MSHVLRRNDSIVMLIDVQERLIPQIHESERLKENCVKLIKGARALGVPIIWTEQYKKGLGDTSPELIEVLEEMTSPLEKMTFGCLQDPGIRAAVDALGRKTLVLCGMETHVCVQQTALAALDAGFRVAIVEDAVSSRTPESKELGLKRMRQEGVAPVNVESILLEWAERAGTPEFKLILPIIK